MPRDQAELPLGESLALPGDGLEVVDGVLGLLEGVEVVEPPIELEPPVPKVLVLDGVLPKVLVLLL